MQGPFTVENRIENTVYLDHKATGRYFRIFVTATQADLYQTWHRRSMGILIRLTNF